MATDPGPAPVPPVFPAAEARALGAAIDRLAGEIRAALATHHELSSNALHGFRGPARERFDAQLRPRLDGLRQHLETLHDQATRLREASAAAEVQVAERRAERRRWEDALASHRAARAVGR